MPTYDYQCEDCQSKVEMRHPAADIDKHNGIDTCPFCNGKLTWIFPCPAVIGTDTAYVADVKTGLEGLGDFKRKQVLAMMRKNGISPEAYTYCPQLCPPGQPLHPSACVPHANAKSYIKQRCQALNYDCNWDDGKQTVKRTEPAEDPFDKPYRPAPDVVAQEVDTIVEREHGGTVSQKKRVDLTEAATERLSGVT